MKAISPGCSLEGLMLKLKLQYSGHLMQRADSFEKTFWCWERLKAGGEGDDWEWDGWMASSSMDVSLGKLHKLVMDMAAWHAAIHGVAKSWTWLSDWTELKEIWGFPRWLSGKESACNVGDLGSIHGSGRSPGEANGNPLRYSFPGNPRNRGAWWATVHGVSKESDTTYQLQQQQKKSEQDFWFYEKVNCHNNVGLS